MEEWKDIEGYEGLYQVSDMGRVKSLAKVGSVEEKILRPFEQDGYERYTLRKDGKKRNCLAQQLVAKAFIPNPHKRKYVDHINTNKHDNRVCNLRWVTRKQNSNNPYTRQHNAFAKRKKKVLWAKDIPVNYLVR